MDEVKEQRARKEGMVSKRACIQNVLERIEDGTIESVVVLARRTDGDVEVGWSDGMNRFELIGLMEIGKQDLIDMLE